MCSTASSTSWWARATGWSPTPCNRSDASRASAAPSVAVRARRLDRGEPLGRDSLDLKLRGIGEVSVTRVKLLCGAALALAGVLSVGAPVLAQTYPAGLYDGLKWRLVGPFRGG